MPDGTAHAIRAIRKRLDLTQADAAEGIGLSLRAYQDIENGVSTPKKVHHMAMQLLSLQVAVAEKKIELATASTRREALDYAALVRGENA